MAATMPLNDALRLTLAMLTGSDEVEEMAADLIGGLNAAGWMLVPFSSGECICPKCGLRHGTSTLDNDTPF